MTENLPDTNVGNIEYIRREDAIDAVNHALDRETILFSFVRKVAISALKKMPSADVVQVVRCRNCKHCYFADNRVPDEQGWVCEINSSEPVNLNGFCSYGERKE